MKNYYKYLRCLHCKGLFQKKEIIEYYDKKSKYY